MLDYTTCLNRHGESWVQDIVERIERIQGVRPSCFYVPLEVRWATIMQDNFSSYTKVVRAA